MTYVVTDMVKTHRVVKENAKKVDIHFVKVKTLYIKTSLLKKRFTFNTLDHMKFLAVGISLGIIELRLIRDY